ncbi:MAG: hypothetical protein AAFQ42_01660 [Pseudomonadota bacterium]
MGKDPRDNQTAANGARARDGALAIREEYEAACAAHTAKSYRLFIGRHPDSPWTADAAERLAQLLGENDA